MNVSALGLIAATLFGSRLVSEGLARADLTAPVALHHRRSRARLGRAGEGPEEQAALHRLAFRNLDGRPKDRARIQPLLEELAAQYGETAHSAVLSGKDIVYRAKIDPLQVRRGVHVSHGRSQPGLLNRRGQSASEQPAARLKQITDWFGAFLLRRMPPTR